MDSQDLLSSRPSHLVVAHREFTHLDLGLLVIIRNVQNSGAGASWRAYGRGRLLLAPPLYQVPRVWSDTQNTDAVHDLRWLSLCDTLLVPDCLKSPMIAP